MYLTFSACRQRTRMSEPLRISPWAMEAASAAAARLASAGDMSMMKKNLSEFL